MSPITVLGKLDWRGWLYTLAASFVSGGASAVTAGFSATMIDPSSFNLGSGLRHTLELVVATFLMSGFLSMFAVLKQSPLPPEEKP